MLEYWIWLANRQGLREGNALKLVELFGDVRALFLAGRNDLQERGVRNTKVLDALGDKSMDGVMEILKTCHMAGIHVMSWEDNAYPDRLRNIADPPLVLYYRGQFPDFDQEAVIGIVGTRKATTYGCHIARQMSYQIARCGGLVVSGMAAGIDITATLGALEGAQRAVGVLACGVDVVYPATTRSIRRQLERTGCLLSEYPPGTRPSKWVFPKRNRIISGLSCGVVVVEAPERSGALITAHHALEQGRDVFAVPGSVNSPQSAGCNRLLSTGAAAAQHGWDVMREYEHLFPDKVHCWTEGKKHMELLLRADRQTEDAPRQREKDFLVRTAKTVPEKSIDIVEQTPYSECDRDEPTSMPEGLSSDEQTVWSLLSRQKKHVDEIVSQSDMGTSRVLGALTLLEIKGLILRHPGKFYTLSE